ncbi:valine--tRNA ligase [Parasphaerochaeta coccoides]|uniref:Valine--tRNA ligase n=1 Tax=Parasphaerochaeta coccoides (strain ATCC BAA-1237 / DSM 17374 / SPN1) TaxID=760011 RepID=F4GHS8_PARC1|nr:valine--tRNA ligase [Parasphaerochaeta coccoides]AEC01616.1 valyl-tRNA synthetase [Parasphaerochaeta coccoides DSM 17374]
MKAIELEKAYDPKDFEDRIYEAWRRDGLFKPQDVPGKPFTIVMPPPNVTGILHMGHALNNSLPDTIIRYQRMAGRKTLWVPGTDHAGIATQNVVERQLAREGLSRHDLGREKFLERTWQVKKKHHSVIVKQLEKIGCSCDWEHERFTMDEGLSRAVREAFVTLYERGLIYKGKYLINYCPHCGTALADDEVEYKTLEGRLYQVSYPYADGSGSISVATTRPETMFGDVAVAVNPDDERYAAVVGKKLRLPLTDREIPIIADGFVDKEFGTGMVKITPAHDPNDWECGRRHNVEAINILNPDGTLNDEVPPAYRGVQAAGARDMVAHDLEGQGYLLGSTPYVHEVGHCYRCNTIIEPYLSDQWFVRMRGMADKALKAWKDGEVTFYPRRWENTYSSWLENIRDWCISRQLWWGHRIPVWYCEDCGEMIVSRNDVTVCPKCGSSHLRQEEDVLDTWFSSWLWPFSTLGWPEDTPDLKEFFPTQTLITGYDIIFFWVARMIMASLEFTGKVPFKDVYMTGLVRDRQGRKMSKSLGNGIDPLEVVDLYGADAMKFTLAYMAAQGQDVLLDMDSFKMGSRFANKIWNASRFLLMRLEGRTKVTVEEKDLSVMDKWIFAELNHAAGKVRAALEGYRFNEASQTVYDFFWNDFCDWYIEASKHNLESNDPVVQDRAVSLLLDILEESLRLLHPFLPFITQEIYSKLPNARPHLMTAPYPEWSASREYPEARAHVAAMQDLVRRVRGIRAELGIPVDKKVHVTVKPDGGFASTGFLLGQRELLAGFINASELTIDTTGEKDVKGAVPVAGQGFECFLFVREAIDVESEMSRLRADVEKSRKALEGVLKKLGNEQFMTNAKGEAIEKENAKKAEFEEKIAKGEKNLLILGTLA